MLLAAPLSMFVAGAVIEMADDDSTILFGANPHTQAVMSLGCTAPAISMGTPFPASHTYDMGIGGSEIDTPGFNQEIVMEVLGMSPTCIDKAPHIEPCVPHDEDTPNYYRCKWTGAAGEIEMPVTPYAEWIILDPYGRSNGGHVGIKTDLVAKVNCTAPPYTSVVAATGYDGTPAFANGAQMTLSLVFARNSTTQVDIPYGGEPGANVVTFQGWVVPPASPAPPASPPSPHSPLLWPGNLFLNHQGSLASFDLTSWPGFKGFSNLCWGSERGDSWHGAVFHSGCNDKGYTLYIARVKYSTSEKIVGAYTRVSWSGGGYSSDASAVIFQLSPNVWKTTAGSGPHGTSTHAIYRSNNYGPTFGSSHDWHISANMKTGYVNMGYAYKCRVGNYGQNTCRDDFIGNQNGWSIQEAEMWSVN